MWLLLIAVLVAFYALWMAMTGRVGAADSTELNTGGRFIVAGVALVAFGIAYAAYHPLDSASEVIADLTPAREVAAITSEAPTVQANRMPVGTTADVSGAVDEVVEPAPVAEGELEPAMPEKGLVVAANEGNGRLSESAAAMEAQAHSVPVAAMTQVPRRASSAPVENVGAVSVPEPASLPVKASPEVLAPPARLGRKSHGPLQILIENQLGNDQQGEQLTLSIEGKSVADIDIDARHPTTVVAVALPRPGRLYYRLEGLSEDGVGSRLKGGGCIRVEDGARYVVRRKPGSHKVFLERMRSAA